MTAEANTPRGTAIPAPAGWPRRIAITIAVLAVYRLASLIPAPGINPDALSDSSAISPGFAAISYVSMLAIGLTPAFSVYALFEFAKLAFEDVRDWGTDSTKGAVNRERGLAVVILLLAAFQAYGVAVALSAVSSAGPARPLVIEPGTAFNVGFIWSNVAGTALMLWLASIITRHGIGSGFWMLFLFPSFMAFFALPAEIVERTRIGEMPSGLSVVIAAVLALIAAAAITLTRRWIAATESAGSVGDDGNLHAQSISVMVWPGFLATAVSGLLVAGLSAFSANAQPASLAGSPYMLALSALLIVFTTYRFVHVHLARTPALRESLRGLVFTTALTAALSYVAIEVLVWHFGAPVSLSSLAWISILAILTPLLPRDINPFLPSSAGEPPITDADFEQR